MHVFNFRYCFTFCLNAEICEGAEALTSQMKVMIQHKMEEVNKLGATVSFSVGCLNGGWWMAVRLEL